MPSIYTLRYVHDFKKIWNVYAHGMFYDMSSYVYVSFKLKKWNYMFYANYDMKIIHGILCSCIYVIHKALAYVFENLFRKPKWRTIGRGWSIDCSFDSPRACYVFWGLDPNLCLEDYVWFLFSLGIYVKWNT